MPSGLTAAIVRAASQAGIGIAVSVSEQGRQRMAYVNDKAARLLDRPAQRLLSESSSRLDPEQLAARDPATRLVSSTARVDGRELSVSFLFDSGARGREETLQRSETRFRDLLDLAPEGVVITTHSRIEYVNPALVRLLGYGSRDELMRVPLSEHLHPDDLSRALTEMHMVLETGQSWAPLELRTLRQDGSYLALEIVAMAVEWHGRPAALAIGRDLSQRRRAKSQVIQAERLTALGTLAAGVAHEINNPLAYVLLNLEYLLREVPKFSGDAARMQVFVDRLGEARHGIERVSTIVRDLRAFAQTSQETKSSVDLRRVLKSAIRVASAELEPRAHLVEDYRPVPAVEGNAARLEQVVLNLLINAVQAFPSADPAENEIKLRLWAEGQHVLIEVADNGPGIPAELLGRIFDPFFTTKPGIGTGLGLPICQSIVHQYGGQISVESSCGRRTAFRVALPARYARLAERVATPAPALLNLRRARVLVVDDELPLASMLSRVLGEEHEVSFATSGQEALARLRQEPEFDVVLCDLLMPGMSGMDVYEALKRELPGLEGRVIFMTGGAFAPRAAEFLGSVPNQRLEKPFDLRQLRRAVRKLSQARLELRRAE